MAAQPAPSKRGLGQRLTAKAGPLPVWAWAAVILGAYLLYTHLHPATAATTTGATTDTTADTSDQTPVSAGDTGNPPASGGGDPGSNVNDTLLSQLSGFQSSIDALTGAVQSSQAFGADGGGSGSADYSGTGSISLPLIPAGTVAVPAAAPAPSSSVHPVATHYYTYAPGKAPKGQTLNEAPKAPPGKTLHFLKGKGYYYA